MLASAWSNWILFYIRRTLPPKPSLVNTRVICYWSESGTAWMFLKGSKLAYITERFMEMSDLSMLKLLVVSSLSSRLFRYFSSPSRSTRSFSRSYATLASLLHSSFSLMTLAISLSFFSSFTPADFTLAFRYSMSVWWLSCLRRWSFYKVSNFFYNDYMLVS